MQEPLFGEGAAQQEAEGSNRDATSLEKPVSRGWSPAASLTVAWTSVPPFPLEKTRKHKYLHSERVRRRVPMSPLLAGNPQEARG